VVGEFRIINFTYSISVSATVFMAAFVLCSVAISKAK